MLLWTFLTASLAAWHYHRESQAALENARTAARHSFGKDLAFRRWATGHGGVYVPVTEKTPPNPYLSHVFERDIQTPSGRRLTLVNPAYMIRQVHEKADGLFGTRGHITSLKPLRPQNAPDPWEREALQAFRRGAPEVSALVTMGDGHYLRLMRPMVAEAGCLKCHSRQGYRVGDVLGGISVSVPWGPYREAVLASVPALGLGYVGIWISGLLFMEVNRRKLQQHLIHRRQMEDDLRWSEARYHSLFENNHAVMLLIDPSDGQIVDVNPSACAYYGYSREELVQMPISRINALSPEEIKVEMERARARECNYFEFRHRLAGGELRDVEVYSGTVDVRGKTLLYSIVHDISDRKRAEEAIRQRTEELQERSAELERFNYTVSHDLKSPLVTVKSFLGFLEQDLAKHDNERIGSDIGHIRRATDKMGQLLDELLEMSRIGRVVNAPTIVPFEELMADLFAVVAGPITARGVIVEVNEGIPPLFGDRPRLLEIWQNLVENAVKYMGDQPSPRIHIGTEGRGEDRVFFVCDNGMGIDPVYSEKIFGLFEKLDRNSEGSGLGLALVKRIVELYGGRIWVESEGSGKGACFRFTLPKAAWAGEG